MVWCLTTLLTNINVDVDVDIKLNNRLDFLDCL